MDFEIELDAADVGGLSEAELQARLQEGFAAAPHIRELLQRLAAAQGGEPGGAVQRPVVPRLGLPGAAEPVQRAAGHAYGVGFRDELDAALPHTASPAARLGDAATATAAAAAAAGWTPGGAGRSEAAAGPPLPPPLGSATREAAATAYGGWAGGGGSVLGELPEAAGAPRSRRDEFPRAASSTDVGHASPPVLGGRAGEEAFFLRYSADAVADQAHGAGSAAASRRPHSAEPARHSRRYWELNHPTTPVSPAFLLDGSYWHQRQGSRLRERRLQEMRQSREREEQVVLEPFRAQPPPVSTTAPRFQAMQAAEAARRSRSVELDLARRRQRSLSPGAFGGHGALPHPGGEEGALRAPFRALPVPWRCSIPLYGQLLVEEHVQRDARLRERSHSLLRASSLPPRLEAARLAEAAAAAGAGAAAGRGREAFVGRVPASTVARLAAAGAPAHLLAALAAEAVPAVPHAGAPRPPGGSSAPTAPPLPPLPPPGHRGGRSPRDPYQVASAAVAASGRYGAVGLSAAAAVGDTSALGPSVIAGAPYALSHAVPARSAAGAAAAAAAASAVAAGAVTSDVAPSAAAVGSAYDTPPKEKRSASQRRTFSIEVPNFESLHKKEDIKLERRKEENKKKLTKEAPFVFHVRERSAQRPATPKDPTQDYRFERARRAASAGAQQRPRSEPAVQLGKPLVRLTRKADQQQWHVAQVLEERRQREEEKQKELEEAQRTDPELRLRVRKAVGHGESLEERILRIAADKRRTGRRVERRQQEDLGRIHERVSRRPLLMQQEDTLQRARRRALMGVREALEGAGVRNVEGHFADVELDDLERAAEWAASRGHRHLLRAGP